MLKIHSFLQRIKNFLCRVLPNGKENYKIYMAVIAYTMITVLILMSPNYIYGLETTHVETMSQSLNYVNSNQDNEETANEAIIRVKQPNPELEFILYNYNSEILQARKTENISNLFLTNHHLLQMNGDSKSIEPEANENQIANMPEHSTDKALSDISEDDGESGAVKVMAVQNKEVQAKEVQAKEVQAKEAQAKEVQAKEVQAKEVDIIVDTNANSKANRADAKTDTKETLSTVKYAINLTSNEVEILQRIVEAEATGEDIKGKMLVANVILNRVNDKYFPDTVEEVVFQKDGNIYQFSPIKDKRYWSVKISEDTIIAVDRVLKGEDSSQGALYFSARSRADKTSMRWFDNNLKFLYEHGGHEFFKNK